MTSFFRSAKSAARRASRPARPQEGGTRISQQDEGQSGESAANSTSAAESVDPTLRQRYLDYCAARISEVFLSLSDERTYALMEEAAADAEIEIGSLGFSEMMDLVTDQLRRSVPLPSFEEFSREYRAHPERFEAVLLEENREDERE